MSSKLGLLISLIFFALFFVLSVDVICIQYHFSDLQSKSTMIGYEIGSMGHIEENDIQSLEEKYHVVIVDISNHHPEFGDMVEYTIMHEYQPLIVQDDVMEIKISRTVVVGYY